MKYVNLDLLSKLPIGTEFILEGAYIKNNKFDSYFFGQGKMNKKIKLVEKSPRNLFIFEDTTLVRQNLSKSHFSKEEKMGVKLILKNAESFNKTTLDILFGDNN